MAEWTIRFPEWFLYAMTTLLWFGAGMKAVSLYFDYHFRKASVKISILKELQDEVYAATRSNDGEPE